MQATVALAAVATPQHDAVQSHMHSQSHRTSAGFSLASMQVMGDQGAFGGYLGCYINVSYHNIP